MHKTPNTNQGLRCRTSNAIKINLFKSKRFNDERLPTKMLSRATLIDRKKLRRPIGPRERELFFNEEKRRDSNIVVLMRIKSKVTLVPEMAREALLLLAKRQPLLRIRKRSKIQKKVGRSTSTLLTWTIRGVINFKANKEFTADELELVFESESDTSRLT